MRSALGCRSVDVVSGVVVVVVVVGAGMALELEGIVVVVNDEGIVVLGGVAAGVVVSFGCIDEVAPGVLPAESLLVVCA